MPIDREAVERVIGLLAESSAGEIEIADGETEVRVVRGGAPAMPVETGPVEAETPEVAAEESVEASASDVPEARSADPTGALEYVTAGLVGLFHRGKAPDDEPIVEVGDEISKGQVVATIEALRKVTEVTAPCDGVIEEFFVADGEAVQYGDRIIAVRPEEE